MFVNFPRLAIFLVLLGVCGCSASGGVPPPAAPQASADRFGAPVVERPLDVSEFVGRPCASLTDVNLEALGLDAPGREQTIVDSRACRWKSDEFDDLSVAFETESDLLVAAYRTREGSAFFPTRVLSYPAARQKTDQGQFNACTVTTGLGPRQSLTADWVGSAEAGATRNACTLAEQATALIISKLPTVG